MVAIKALGWWVAYLDQDIFCLSPIGGILCFKILTSLKKLVLANDFKAHQHRLWGWQGRARTWGHLGDITFSWVILDQISMFCLSKTENDNCLPVVCTKFIAYGCLLNMSSQSFPSDLPLLATSGSMFWGVNLPMFCRLFPGWFRWRFARFFFAIQVPLDLTQLIFAVLGALCYYMVPLSRCHGAILVVKLEKGKHGESTLW